MRYLSADKLLIFVTIVMIALFYVAAANAM